MEIENVFDILLNKIWNNYSFIIMIDHADLGGSSYK